MYSKSYLAAAVIAIAAAGLVTAYQPSKIAAQSNDPTTLITGNNLTIDEVYQIAYNPLHVIVDPSSWQRVNQSHQLLLKAAKEEHPIYGLNRGVGLNKDKKIFNGNTLSVEARKASEIFNKNLIYSHSAGIEPDLSKKIVFPILLIRLNMMLNGHTGVSPEVVEMFVQFINHRIQPVIPGLGSIGQGDITILSHIGLAMMGQGDVICGNERLPASEILKRYNLKPIKPFAKDALSILSSNSYSAAMGCIIVTDIMDWLNKSILVMGLSLEGLDGNIAPLLSQVQQLRPFKGQMEIAQKLLSVLEGSYLFEQSETRALQDPLSYRTINQIYGAILTSINRISKKINNSYELF